MAAGKIVFREAIEFNSRRRQPRRQQRREVERGHGRTLPMRLYRRLGQACRTCYCDCNRFVADRGIRPMRCLQFAVFLFVCAFATGAAAEYPDRPIHLIVPQAAGSATDTVARILGAALGDEIGQQIIVDDRPGGALTVGLDLTAKSAPDGYTLGMGPIGALAITPHLVAQLPFDIARDFQPIIAVTKGHLLLAVSPTTPFQSVQELIDYAGKNPGKLLNA